mgnify:CR=1 FL=1
MISLIASVVLGLSALGVGLNSTPVIDYPNNAIVEETNNNITNVEWHNNEQPLAKDEDSMILFSKYGIDPNEAARSLDVYVQEEYVPFEEIIPTKYLTSELGVSTLDIGDSQTQEFTHNKGYIKFTTKAYALGFYDGGIVYHIEVTTEQQKSFFMHHNDNLIIRHGENATSFVDDRYPASGERFTPCTIYWPYDPNNPTIADETEHLSPNYSCAESGVYYTFKNGGTSSFSDVATVSYGFTTVNADYYLVASDTTSVQPVYVHNYKIFTDSISISFKNVGVSIDLGNMVDVMEGSIMMLKGYNDRLYHNTYTLSPEDWGFDERYYFKNEGLKYSTIELNDFVIDTERLRCGYIEEEYINLSPNRYDAGDAYLELTFNEPIYEFSTYVSLWSDNEYLYSTQGDYAYIQYLDENGNWQTFIDLLSVGLPTDRNNQKHFEYDFIEGTYGIKFVAHKESPNTDRNKGRISIGETKFVTYDID